MPAMARTAGRRKASDFHGVETDAAVANAAAEKLKSRSLVGLKASS
jgi:hypothetical protein